MLDNLTRIVLHFFIKLNSTTPPIVSVLSYLALGLIASSLVSSASIPLKIAGAGFILGQLLFVGPLFYQAINGRDSKFRYIIPAGGVSVMAAWPALMFA